MRRRRTTMRRRPRLNPMNPSRTRRRTTKSLPVGQKRSQKRSVAATSTAPASTSPAPPPERASRWTRCGTGGGRARWSRRYRPKTSPTRRTNWRWCPSRMTNRTTARASEGERRHQSFGTTSRDLKRLHRRYRHNPPPIGTDSFRQHYPATDSQHHTRMSAASPMNGSRYVCPERHPMAANANANSTNSHTLL